MPKAKKSKTKAIEKKGKRVSREQRQRVGLYLDRKVYAKLRKRLTSEGHSVTWWFEQRVADYLG